MMTEKSVGAHYMMQLWVLTLSSLSLLMVIFASMRWLLRRMISRLRAIFSSSWCWDCSVRDGIDEGEEKLKKNKTKQRMLAADGVDDKEEGRKQKVRGKSLSVAITRESWRSNRRKIR